MKVLAHILLSILLPGVISGGEFPAPDYSGIAEGVWYGRAQSESPPMVYHIIKVDREVNKLDLRPILPHGKETLGQAAARLAGGDAALLGAVTGDYFHLVKEYDLILPWGILAEEDKLLFSPDGKSAFCSGAEGYQITVPVMKARVQNSPGSPSIRVVAVNRPVELEGTDCAVFNSIWGEFAPEVPEGFALTVEGDPDLRLDRQSGGKVVALARLPVKVPIPENGFVLLLKELPKAGNPELKLGSPVRVDMEVSGSPSAAIGGGPRLVRSGEISVELRRENFGSGLAFYINNSRHPRSAVGLGPGGRFIYLVVVEGRSEQSRGATLRELSRLLLSLGGVEAMAFDGGRSVSMYVAGKEVVGGDREIANALGVFQVEK